jgi:hypothetical protein
VLLSTATVAEAPNTSIDMPHKLMELTIPSYTQYDARRARPVWQPRTTAGSGEEPPGSVRSGPYPRASSGNRTFPLPRMVGTNHKVKGVGQGIPEFAQLQLHTYACTAASPRLAKPQRREVPHPRFVAKTPHSLRMSDVCNRAPAKSRFVPFVR